MIAPHARAQRTDGVARGFRMGFSALPPRPDMALAVQSLQLWSARADAAMLHVTPPWSLLLANGDVGAHLATEYRDLVRFYRSKQMRVYLTVDPTDGLAREREARELRLAGRSIRERRIQEIFRSFVLQLVEVVKPDVLCLGAETNLVRLASPRAVYEAMRSMLVATAASVRVANPGTELCVTVQADVAWGRLQGGRTWQGIAGDLRDFPYARSLGISAYPYLAAWTRPEDIPLDYLARLRDAAGLPVFVAEGGWSSEAARGTPSSPAVQARYVDHMARVVAQANASAWIQLTFADLDAKAYDLPAEYDATMPYFLHLGFVQSDLRPKPALAAWDRIFARRREE